MISQLEKFGLNLVLFAKLLGTNVIGLVFLLFLLVNKRALKLNFRELLFIGAVLLQLIFSFILSGNNYACLTNTIFYFSFLIVYVALKDKNSEDLIRLLRYMIISAFLFTLIEFIVLNSPLTSYVWYFSEEHAHRSVISGLQRAQGLGAISSSSSAIAVFSLALYSIVVGKSSRLYEMIVFTTVLLLMSGTGFFLLIAYIFLHMWINSGGAFKKLVKFIGFISLLVLAIDFFELIGLNRFTFDYFFQIYELKINLYKEKVFDSSISSMFFGGQSNISDPLIVTSSDFAIMGIFDSMGIYSTILILSAPLWIIGLQRQFQIILILYWLSLLHYPAIGSPIGCFFFGLCLALCRNSAQKNQKLKITQGS